MGIQVGIHSRSTGWSAKRPPATATGTILAVFALLFLRPAHASADVIWLNDQSQPIFGIVNDTQSNESKVAFSKTVNGTEFEPLLLDRSNIKTIVINVDKVKLESLAPDKPESWFDHAEWLSTQKQDPVARKLAIRLFLITAKHASQKSVRDSAIRNLIPLARTPRETQAFIRLSWLETGAPIPKAKSTATAEPVEMDSQQKQLALEIIQAVRRKSPIDPDRWSELDNVIPAPAIAAVRSISQTDQLSSQQLGQLVALEFRLRNPELPGVQSKPTWLELQSAVQQVELDFPTIDNVTKIDPSKTLYRDGTWLKR